MGSEDIKISQEYQLQTPDKQMAFAIPASEWEHLRNRIQQATSRKKQNILFGASMNFFGLAGAAFLAALTIPEGQSSIPGMGTHALCWTICIGGLIVAFSLLGGWYAVRGERQVGLDILVEDMERMAKRYGSGMD